MKIELVKITRDNGVNYKTTGHSSLEDAESKINNYIQAQYLPHGYRRGEMTEFAIDIEITFVDNKGVKFTGVRIPFVIDRLKNEPCQIVEGLMDVVSSLAICELKNHFSSTHGAYDNMGSVDNHHSNLSGKYVELFNRLEAYRFRAQNKRIQRP